MTPHNTRRMQTYRRHTSSIHSPSSTRSTSASLSPFPSSSAPDTRDEKSSASSDESCLLLLVAMLLAAVCDAISTTALLSPGDTTLIGSLPPFGSEEECSEIDGAPKPERYGNRDRNSQRRRCRGLSAVAFLHLSEGDHQCVSRLSNCLTEISMHSKHEICIAITQQNAFAIRITLWRGKSHCSSWQTPGVAHHCSCSRWRRILRFSKRWIRCRRCLLAQIVMC